MPKSPAPGTWFADPSHFGRQSRRDFLYAGWAGGVGLTLGQLLQSQSLAAENKGEQPKAKSVIQIYLSGGFAHMDSFDPKPDSPVEYRGNILSTVETSIPGVRFSSHMANTAKVADKMTVVRSMTHSDVDHGRGQHSMFTGYRPSPALVYPSLGSVISNKLGQRGAVPPYVCVPTQGSEYFGSGYLSNAFGPFALGADPARRGFQVRDLNMAPGIDDARFDKRKGWKELVDDHFHRQANDDSLATMNSFYQRAYDMLSSPEAKAAFSLEGEDEATKELYGIGGGQSTSTGPRFMIARRLVEAGVRCVTVTYGAWDTHSFHYRGIERAMPDFDRGFSGLIQDLDQRGLLDSTLVLVTSEFGRTPKINAGGGRDHWPRVFSIVMAGGGIKRGQTFGESDRLAAEPADQPLSVEDYTHTVYHLLGIDGGDYLMSPGDRPQRIVMDGKVVPGLLG
ncbi:hypothetical protein KOR42_44250 [Thalassoglobus neptunius]|uniref:Sulfatase n=1 Tax=Thalassoglobus neptunius TaxID=1938619 RepID=A0A5C5W051_9PLAN|nr:DUF1501 domain-containing protein [Thalassoglobus neptunius]TWT43545.1 hypothetical protein KOR42_44250 [Thalassoglobus neptunius]